MASKLKLEQEDAMRSSGGLGKGQRVVGPAPWSEDGSVVSSSPASGGGCLLRRRVVVPGGGRECRPLVRHVGVLLLLVLAVVTSAGWSCASAGGRKRTTSAPLVIPPFAASAAIKPTCARRCVLGALASDPASCWNHPDYQSDACAWTWPPDPPLAGWEGDTQ